MTELLCSTYAPLVEDRTGCLLNIGSNYQSPNIWIWRQPGFFPVQRQQDLSNYVDYSFQSSVVMPQPSGAGFEEPISIYNDDYIYIYQWEQGTRRYLPSEYHEILDPWLEVNPTSAFLLSSIQRAEQELEIPTMEISSYIPASSFVYGNDVCWMLNNTDNTAETLLGPMKLFGRISEDGQPLGLSGLNEIKLHERIIHIYRNFRGDIGYNSTDGYYITSMRYSWNIDIVALPPASYQYSYNATNIIFGQYKRQSKANWSFAGYGAGRNDARFLAYPYHYTPTSSYQDEVNRWMLSTNFINTDWDRGWVLPLLSGDDETYTSSLYITSNRGSFIDFKSAIKDDEDFFFAANITAYNRYEQLGGKAIYHYIPASKIVWHNIETFLADRDIVQFSDSYRHQRSGVPYVNEQLHTYACYMCNSSFISGFEQLTSTYFSEETII